MQNNIISDRLVKLLDNILILIVFFFFFWSLSMTSDWPGYEMSFLHEGYWDLGFGFDSICNLVRLFDGEYFWVNRVFQTIIFFGFLLFVNKLSPTPMSVFIAFIIIDYVSMINLIRFYSAFALLLSGWYYFCITKQHKLGFLLLIIPLFVHTGSVPLYLPLVIYLLFDATALSIRWQVILTCILCVIIAWVFISGFVPLGEEMTSYRERYSTVATGGGAFYMTGGMLVLIFLLMANFFKNRQICECDPIFRKLFIFSMLPFLFLGMSFNTGGLVAGRFIYSFTILWFIFMSYPIKYLPKSLGIKRYGLLFTMAGFMFFQKHIIPFLFTTDNHFIRIQEISFFWM